MSSLASICSEKYDAIPKWQFWRRWEREFWLWGIIAEYLVYNPNKELSDKAIAIANKYETRIKKKYGNNSK